ncbi:MAG: DNA polymerase III subunit beta [Clostridia bacterium]|nr:DNA polymerase III subunit beta [Clostridia bacterium]
MKFICEKNKLVEALTNVQRAVSQRSTIAALEGILLKTENDCLTLCGYNTELGITTQIEVSVQKEGSVVLNAHFLTDIIRKLSGDVVEIEKQDDLVVKIISGTSKFELLGINADEFPSLPSVESVSSFTMPVNVLKNMIKQTIFAVSEMDTKPVHTGTLFEIKDKTLTLVSVDGYRLALRQEKIKEDLELSFVVPGKTLREILRLLPEKEEEIVTVSAGMRHIIFSVNNYVVISRLLEGEFIDYKSTIPEKSKMEVSIKTDDFLNSIDRVSLLITDRLKSPVKCIFAKDSVHVSCITPIGKADDEVACTGKAKEELEIAFNNKYMSDALRNAETDEVKITLSGPLSPIKITSKDGDSFIFIVLPVRVKS